LKTGAEERKEVERHCKNCTMRSFINCTLHQMLLGRSNQGGSDLWGT